MAQIAVSYIVSRVASRLTDVLIQESSQLVKEVRSKVEWIEKELRYMGAFIQHLEGFNDTNLDQLELELEDDIRTIALQAEDVIDTFLSRKSVKRRKKGVEYLLEKYDTAKEMEQISNRMREISERISNYEQTNIVVTVETPGVGVEATTIVSPALYVLDHIRTQNLFIWDAEVIEIVEHVRDDYLGETQNIMSNLNSTGEWSQRAKVWLEEIRDICHYTVGVAENFIARRERRLRMGRLWQVLYLFEPYASEREFKKQMIYISTQLEDALYRKWIFGDGGKDRGYKTGSRSRPVPPLSLVRLTMAKIPLFLLNDALLPLLFVMILININFLMFGPEFVTEDANKRERSKQLTVFFLFDLVDFMVFFLFYVLPVELMVFIQFGSLLYTVIGWTVSLGRCLDENLKTTRRYLALMRALFSDIESTEGLNERQKVWVEQLRVVAQNGQSLVAVYPKDWFLFLIRGIRYARDINDLLNEIIDISERKNIYGFANIMQGSESENIVEHSDTEEYPHPHASTSYRYITGLERKFQLIKGEMQLMDALFHDVPDIAELEEGSKIWVEQMQGIVREARSVLHACARELEHKPKLMIYILRYPVRYDIARKVNSIRNKIEDASRRRNADGLIQLQSRAESSLTVQILRRRAQPSLIVKESRIVGLDEDIEALTAHLLSDEPRRCITSILGIEGVGKTTLAKMIFDNKAVIDGFDCQIWVSLSPSCSVQELLQKIAKEAGTQMIRGGQPQDKLTTHDKILKSLSFRKHLIVVDSIETSHVLDTLKESIPDMSTASRFLLTTRDANVAQKAGTRSFIHHLHLLDDENSWTDSVYNKFEQFVEEKNSPRTKLAEVGKKIVAKCGGLPSEILKMSNLLSLKDDTQEEWSRVLEQPNQGQNPWSEALDTFKIVLPPYLSKCLFYFELFPANFEIPARRLVVLWVAECLVNHGEDQEPPEEVAERYLTELMAMNLVQIVKRKPNGKVKTCRLPHSLREFWLTKANETRIRQVADRLDQRDIWHNHIHGNTTNDSDTLRTYYKNVLSFLSFDAREGSRPGQEICNFLNLCMSSKCLLLLRVLDLEGVHKPKLPKDIARLTRLRYLGLRWTYLESLPSFISSLLKLQTLDLKHTYIHTLTSSIWKMELRHLFLSESYRTRFPPKPKWTGNSLSDLQTLWGLFVDEETPVKGGLDKLVNIRKLGIACQSMSPQQEAMESQLDAVADWIGELIYLQSLRLKSSDEEGRPWNLHLKSLKYHINLTDIYLLGSLSSPSILSQFPPSLVELTLSHSRLEDDPMPILKNLPNLRSLSLLAESYVGEIMVCHSQSFAELYVLKVWKLEKLEKWIIEEEALPSLRQLEIRSCPGMKRLPSGLEHVNGPLELKLTDMPKEINKGKSIIPPNCQVHTYNFQ